MTTLLAIIPHPDDETYGFGGTIALAARAGWRCIVHCATNGELGERHDGVVAEPESLGPVRAAELEASCKVLGAERPVLWGLPDGGLAQEPGQRERLSRLIREVEPQVVLTLGADGAYGHPDHLAVHRWVREAWEASDCTGPALLLAAFPRGLFRAQYEKCVASRVMGDRPEVMPADLGANLRSRHQGHARDQARSDEVAPHSASRWQPRIHVPARDRCLTQRDGTVHRCPRVAE